MNQENRTNFPEPSSVGTRRQWLYRGTTNGWPGNAELQNQRITCTTTDPFVATLFAIECRNHGQSVVLIASRAPFIRLTVPENWFGIIESAVNIAVPPVEFAKEAELIVEVGVAISALEALGFNQIPQRITGKNALQEALEESHRFGLRLSLDQIDAFNRLIAEANQ